MLWVLTETTDDIRHPSASTFRKDQRVNLRISSRDLDAFRKRALQEGIPYQTLIASVLHKYVEGQLKAEEPEHTTQS